MRLIPFVLVVLSVVIAYPARADSVSTGAMTELEEKYGRYLTLSRDAQDEWGNVHSMCDGLLFTSIYFLAGGDADIRQYLGADGQWFRHPSKSCFPKHSKSTFSLDMLHGLMFYLWRQQDLHGVRELISYIKKNGGHLGQAATPEVAAERTLVPDYLMQTLSAVETRLGGKSVTHLSSEEPWNQPSHGYRGHLRVLYGLLWAQLAGNDPRFRDFLEKAVSHQPRNALFHAVRAKLFDGPVKPAIDVLLDEKLFPADRLPTAKERCTEYLFQRDQLEDGKVTGDWLPCPDENRLHSGTDFLFAASLLLESMNYGDKPVGRFDGVVVPLVTPYSADRKKIDLKALRSHVAWLAAKPIDGLFPLSGMGQWGLISYEEKQKIIETVVAAAGRIPVFPGIGSTVSIEETIRLGVFAAEKGAKGLVVVTPPFIGKADTPDQQQLIAYFTQVADAVPLPVLVYDPQTLLTNDSVALLARHKNLVAIKYRGTKMEDLLRLTKMAGPGISVLSGREHNLFLALSAGARGVIGGGNNLFPEKLKEIFRAAKKKHPGTALRLNQELIALNDVFSGSKEIKYALRKYFKIPVEYNNRGAEWEPISAATAKEMDKLMRGRSAD